MDEAASGYRRHSVDVHGRRTGAHIFALGIMLYFVHYHCGFWAQCGNRSNSSKTTRAAKLNQYARYGCRGTGDIQACGVASGLRLAALSDPGLYFKIACVIAA
jgi:hypothetical protein